MTLEDTERHLMNLTAYMKAGRELIQNLSTRQDGDTKLCWCPSPAESGLFAERHTAPCLAARKWVYNAREFYGAVVESLDQRVMLMNIEDETLLQTTEIHGQARPETFQAARVSRAMMLLLIQIRDRLPDPSTTQYPGGRE